MKNFILLFSCLFLSMGLVIGQNNSITGTVLDEYDDPIMGATVLVKDTSIGTITDQNGNFSLEVPEGAKTLIIKFIGKIEQEVGITPVVKVTLKNADQSLDEVMVVAYGTAKKESFTGSADVVKASKLEKRTVANVSKALEGAAAGVQTTSGSGQPGSGSSIVIRGFGSINASQDPLYVLDGIPYNGQINAINPNDIESISILKDASAATLYGARAANGVVMITTKKGQTGSSKVNLKTSWGIASRAIPRYETLDEAGYLENVFHAYRTDILANYNMTNEEASAYAIQAMRDGLQNWAPILGINEQYNPFNYPIDQLIDITTGKVRSDAKLRYSQDWIDEMTANNPLRQEYILSVTGGNEKTKYMYSLGYLNEEGVLKTTMFERYTGRLSVDTELHKYAKGGANLSYTRGKSNSYNTSSSATSNPFYSAQLMPSIYPVYLLDADGNTLRDESGNRLFDYGANRPSGAQGNFNSIATLYDDKYGSTNDNVSGRTYLEIGNFTNFLQGLKFTVNLGIDYQLATGLTYYNPYFGNSAAVNGTIYKYDEKTFSYTTNQLLSYDRTFGDHHIDAFVGHEFYHYRSDFLSGTKTGLPFGGLYELDAAANISDVRSYQHNYGIESVLSRVNYDYQNKYYLSASLRSDASSRFKDGNRRSNFWSAGASWRMSEEEFMNDVEWIDNLTLKGSYGYQGNDNIGKYYAWQALYDLKWPNATLSGALASSLGNDLVTWEKNGNFNIGVEARLFDRMNATIEWYQRSTKDLLLSYPMAPSTGFDSYLKNVGNLRNRGLEISLSGEIIKNKDFGWMMTILASTINNKVTSLSDRKEIVTGNYIIKKGETLNSFYTAVSAGVNPETGNQLFKVWTIDANGKRQYLDDTEDINMASQCREISGSRIPDIYGSITNDLRYKDFDLSILCTYSIGGKILDGVYRNMAYSSYVGQSIHADLANAWKYPGDKTDVPRVRFGHNYVVTDKDLIDASYFSIKNITLGYSLPKKLLKQIRFDSVRIFATADNLLLFSHKKGMDPQYNFTGGTNFIYTPTRVVSMGLDIKF